MLGQFMFILVSIVLFMAAEVAILNTVARGTHRRANLSWSSR